MVSVKLVIIYEVIYDRIIVFLINSLFRAINSSIVLRYAYSLSYQSTLLLSYHLTESVLTLDARSSTRKYNTISYVLWQLHKMFLLLTYFVGNCDRQSKHYYCHQTGSHIDAFIWHIYMSTFAHFKGQHEGHAHLLCKYAYIWSMLHFTTWPLIPCLFFILVIKCNSTILKNDTQIVDATNLIFNVKTLYNLLK